MAGKQQLTGRFDDEIDQLDDAWEAKSWTPVIEDEGERLVLVEGRPFYGTFMGTKVITQPNPETGKMEEVTLCMFESNNGKRYNMWANYRLNEALTKGMVPGSAVKLVSEGKSDIGNGRTMNRLSVYVAS
jgi:hypothetical protein